MFSAVKYSMFLGLRVLSSLNRFQAYNRLPKSVNRLFFRAIHSSSQNYTSSSGSQQILCSQDTITGLLKCQDRTVDANPSHGRVMVIDGTSVIYRAYYKLLAKLHHGYLSHADGNGDWVLTIFTALSLIIDVLELIPTHAAVVFDHDGELLPLQQNDDKVRLFFQEFRMVILPSHTKKILWQKRNCYFAKAYLKRRFFEKSKGRFCERVVDFLWSRRNPEIVLTGNYRGHWMESPKGYLLAGIQMPMFLSSEPYLLKKKYKDLLVGLTFRHTLYPAYKSNRPPTPDTIVQGLQYLKAALKAMSIKVIEVPGVEADDVIGTLAMRSVDAGYKVRVVSPDKDFFQILCPSLRLLRIAPRGFEMVSFGLEDFSKKYGALEPSQFVDIISLIGDKADNIPGVEGIGNVHAVQLITKFGSLENLLQCVEQVEEERIKKALIKDADQAVLSKNLALLRSDLPFYMVPFDTSDLMFKKPEDNGEKFTSLVVAIGAYAEGFSTDPIIRRVLYLWKKLEREN